jgi:hypothetical protein
LASCAVSCGRVYEPRAPRVAASPQAEVSVETISAVVGAAMYPPHGSVTLVGRYASQPGAVLAVPRLTRADSAPCSNGVDPVFVSSETDAEPEQEKRTRPNSGWFAWIFRRDQVDGLGPFGQSPLALDVTVVRSDGERGRECLRVPLIQGGAAPEWIQNPRWSVGTGFTLLLPFHRVYGVAALPAIALRFGPWFGPLRVRPELGIGGAYARSSNANLVGYSYRGALLLDTLVLHVGRFGLGVAAGYDVTAISFGPNVESLSHEGAGYQGLLHGPRAGLVFTFLPPILSGAFRARPDAASASLEFYGAAAWSGDRESATPAIFVTMSIDGSF